MVQHQEIVSTPTRSSTRLTTKSHDSKTTHNKTSTTPVTITAKSEAKRTHQEAKLDQEEGEEKEEALDSGNNKDDEDGVNKAVKKLKKVTGTKEPLQPNAFTNTVMPNPLVLPDTPEGCIKITSWNVSGLNASLKKGFKTYIAAENADVICIQEHKVQQPLMNLVDPKVYPFSWWGFEEKKGYGGVAMFCKTKPISVTAGLPTHPDPKITKGRIVTLEYPTCYILGCYVPNSGQGLVRLNERMVWDKAMKAWLLELKGKGKEIIWTGDLNVCHQPIDLRNPATNTRSAGFTKEERDDFSEILNEVDLVDTYREIAGTGPGAEGHYSYFSYRFNCRAKGIGWRLDYFVTDQKMFKERVVESVIREQCYGASDHVPIVLVIKHDL
ncbi:hypothetical protein FBU30_010889 [Linnemannia zychae]|nr:hypothetical protein FBU30_010889 [Linnemannia zychae]